MLPEINARKPDEETRGADPVGGPRALSLAGTPERARQDQDLLHKLSRQVPGVIYQFRCYPDGRSCFPYASDAIRDIYEVTPEQVREDASVVHALLHPEDHAGVLASMRESAATLTPWQYEYRVILPRQGMRWRRGEARPERLEDGSVLWHGFITDITDRKQVEQDLRASQERFQLVLEATHDHMWVWDIATDRMNWPGRVRESSALTAAELDTHAAFRRRIHAEDRAVYDVSIRDALAGGKDGWECEFRLRRGDGTYDWAHGRGRVVRDEQGRAVQMIGATVDISGRKNAEAALREREQRWLLALEGSNTGAWDWDVPSGTVIYAQRWKRILGYSDEEIGNTVEAWEKLVHPEDLPAARRAVEAVVSGQTGEYHAEHRLRCKDGSWKWTSDRGTTIERQADGKPRRVVGALIDISDRKQAEADRAQLQAQLMQSQKMEAIGQLSGGIAHDFNNILGIIMGNIDLAMMHARSAHGASVIEYLMGIQEAGERARDLVKKMLVFSRRRGDSDARPIALQGILSEVKTILARTFPSGIQIAEHIDPDAPPVCIDPTDIHQVMLNLAINARDAIGEHGRIDVTLRHRRKTAEVCSACREDIRGEYVELTVSDTGAGIATEDLAWIFEPFFSTKEMGKGSGMGLSMVQGIVHKAGGHILVDTVPGAGTSVRMLFLPAAAGSDEEASQKACRTPLRAATGRRVLLVDDEPALASILARTLENSGYRVQVFTDSGAALQAFRAAPEEFDVLVTDQTMPGLSGDRLACAVMEEKPGMPVILCTGFSSKVDEATAIALGITRFLPKPVSTIQLIQAVHQALTTAPEQDTDRDASATAKPY
ncbi:MAG: PAS domain-containing protein [Gammaproteobacteria bacterium]|nr:PAS domain-containing protein [Gammaproteobacteria bacterium]